MRVGDDDRTAVAEERGEREQRREDKKLHRSSLDQLEFGQQVVDPPTTTDSEVGIEAVHGPHGLMTDLFGGVNSLTLISLLFLRANRDI